MAPHTVEDFTGEIVKLKGQTPSLALHSLLVEQN